MSAYYNEFDPAAAEWLRNLIACGLIAPGDVDTRSIKDVNPDDLKGYTQCHFFAGIGGWSAAARLAGWPDDRPLWTGSCPCQPFSVAGKGGGVDDARHLWPDFFRLIRAARPPVVMGEQVAGTAGEGWFDGVAADLEGAHYAARAVDVPACAVDAPHIRSRLYWVASGSVDNAMLIRAQQSHGQISPGRHRVNDANAVAGNLLADDLGDGRWPDLARRGSEGRAVAGRADGERANGHMGYANFVVGRLGKQQPAGKQPQHEQDAGICLWPGSRDGSMVATPSIGRREGRSEPELRSGRSTAAGAASPGVLADTHCSGRQVSTARRQSAVQSALSDAHSHASIGHNSARTFWSDHEWLVCHDGKARRTKPGLSLLAHGIRGGVAVLRPDTLGIEGIESRPALQEPERLISRVSAWKGFGNAIVPVLAAEVIAAFMESDDGQ